MFSKLYKNLRKNTEVKNLKDSAYEVFHDRVKKELEDIILKEDKYGEVTVVWDPSEAKETLRAVSSEYSIDINANGIEFDMFGEATLSNSGQYSIQMQCYRNSETGKSHDYIDRLTVSGVGEEEFIKSFLTKFRRDWEEANPKEEEDG